MKVLKQIQGVPPSFADASNREVSDSVVTGSKLPAQLIDEDEGLGREIAKDRRHVQHLDLLHAKSQRSGAPSKVNAHS